MFKQKKSIIKHIFTYASSQYFSQFVGFFTAIFMRRFLGPFNMGVWNLLKIVADYATYTHLGTTSTVFYKVPYHRGRGELEEADNVKNVVFSYLTITSFIAGMGITAYAFIFKSTLLPQMFWGLLVVAVLLLFRRVYTYYVMLLRANKDFTVLSKSIIFDAIVNLTLVLVLIKNFHLKGLFLTVVLMPILNVLFIRRLVNYDIKYKFDLRKLGGYIKFGFPLFITSILAMLLQSVDKIMIARFLGLEALGFYSVALMARGYSVGLSRNFNVVITPHFLEDFGKTKDLKTAGKYLKTPAILMSTCMAMILGFVYLSAPVFVDVVLPKFISGIPALKLLLIATFFYTASPQSDHFLIALNKQARLIPITSFVIVLNIIGNYILIKMGYGITGVAAATSIAAFAAFSVTLFYAMMHLGGILNALKFMGKVVVPLLYATLVVIGLDRLIMFDNVWVMLSAKIIAFGFFFSPWIYKVNKATGIIAMVIGVIKGLFRKKRGEETTDE
ncbi:MAG: oligosaccharide flippase family protein [Candidatus Aadella gelida]|nr:oligosaccharide flippase family protein [Candidatus Aadella gelida]